jgi:transcriptional/translational regulatory protein YebC/TACO1
VRAGDTWLIYCPAAEFAAVKQGLDRLAVPLIAAELAYVPVQTVSIDEPKLAARILKLTDGLEDNDDVQGVFSNEELSAAAAAGLDP